MSKLLRWTFKHSLIAIIHHAFSDKTIIVWSPFSFEAITFLVQNSKVEGAKKFFLELWIGNERNVAFIFEKHAQFRLQEFFYEHVQLVQKLKKDFEFSRQKQLLATLEGKRRKI